MSYYLSALIKGHSISIFETIPSLRLAVFVLSSVVVCVLCCVDVSPEASRNINYNNTVVAQNGVSVCSGSGESPPNPPEAFVDEYMERRENNAEKKHKIKKQVRYRLVCFLFSPEGLVLCYRNASNQ